MSVEHKISSMVRKNYYILYFYSSAKGHALWRKAVSKVQVINTIDEIPTDKRQVQKLVRKNIERSKQVSHIDI